jgi:hypothetical protein
MTEAKNSGSTSQSTHYRNDGKPDQREVEPVEPLPVEPEELAPPDMLPLPDVSELPDVLELPEDPAGLVGLDG